MSYSIFDDADDPIDADEDSPRGKARRRVSANQRAMDEAVRRVAERDRARRKGYDPTVTVRFVDPATLRKDT
jgi:hypothetical protein